VSTVNNGSINNPLGSNAREAANSRERYFKKKNEIFNFSPPGGGRPTRAKENLYQYVP
jgi:hypothetical protein